MSGFDGDDYRKRVLAAVQRRGGVPASDPFEWYDLPLTDVRDSTAQEQVDAVWAFWQKQRDSPKYRGLVTALLAAHRAAAPLLLDRSSRRALAEQVRLARSSRTDDAGGALEAAAQRLLDRFGGVPRSKLAGLRALGLGSGLSEGDVDARLAALPVVEVQSTTAPPVPPAVVRQLRADLDELGRLVGSPPPATLYDLLGLLPGASPSDVEVEREAAAARNRQLRPDRQRALVDDLLAAVTTLLVEADGSAYLDAVADEVAERLRPRLAAAVLVEDVLTSADAGVLLEEAARGGLDEARARAVVARLALEAGVPVPAPASDGPGHGAGGRARPEPYGSAARAGQSSTGAGGARHAPSSPPGAGPHAAAEVRAALASGQAARAERLVEQALHRDAGPSTRALAAEVAAVLSTARQQWRAAEAALASHRWHEADGLLADLAAMAVDLPSPGGRTVGDALDQAKAGLTAAAAAVAGGDEDALLQAWGEAPDAPVVLAALRRLGVRPPSAVRAVRAGSSVLVTWTASPSAGVDYRVVRVTPDGSRSPVGATPATSLEDGGVRPGVDLPRYVVQARRAGVLSDEATTASAAPTRPVDSGQAAARLPGAPVPDVGAGAPAGPLPAGVDLVPVPWLAASVVRRGLGLSFPPPAQGRVEVRRLAVVGRPPEPGTAVDPDALGPVVPRVGPGLAVDARPDADGRVYVAVTRGPEGTASGVAGASVAVVDLAPPAGLRVEPGRLRWDWPAGCTEVLVLVRTDAPPSGPGDPSATARKVTNTRYDLDGGAPLPDRSGHVAVHACTRAASTLLVGLVPARLELPGGELPGGS